MEYFGDDAHVSTYWKFRPSPPKELIQRLADFLREGGGIADTAVDVGCGSGQSTVSLSPYFRTIIGLEPSAKAVSQANQENKLPNVAYKVSSAEALVMDNQAADAVIAVQAVHWFDKNKFYAEVDRILKEHGVLALIGYHLPELKMTTQSCRISSTIKKYYTEVLKEYVLPESRQVYIDNYRDPIYNYVSFVEGKKMIREEDFVTEVQANLQEISGYISSWSGFQNYVKKNGEESGKKLVNEFEKECATILGEEVTSPFTVQYRYFMLIGRKGH